MAVETEVKFRPLREAKVVEPRHIVERVYELPGLDPYEPAQLDVATHDRHTKYLKKRFRGKDPGSDGFYQVVPQIDVVRRPEYKGPFFTRRQRRRIAWGTLGLTLGLNADINAGSALQDLREKVAEAEHGIERLLPQGTHMETLTIPGQRTDTNHSFQMESGAATPDPADVDQVIADIKGQRAEGNKIVSLTIKGQSSDEWGTRASLGVPETKPGQNGDLAKTRAHNFRAGVETKAKETQTDLPPITEQSSQSILSKADIAAIDQALAEGHTSFEDALTANKVKNGRLSTKLRKVFAEKFTKFRRVQTDLITQAPDTVKTFKVVNDPPPPPEDKKHPYKLNLWPLLGLLAAGTPRIGLKDILKIREKEEYVPGRVPDLTWVKLYPEALHEDGDKLNEYPFLQTRKGQELIRDERVQGCYNFEYNDNDGDRQTVKMLFVDHVPTSETLGRFSHTLISLSHMEEGKTGEKINTIVVYPSENAGWEHQDPKKVGLGIDEQMHGAVVGIATPLLKTIEVHMPPDPSEDHLKSFDGVVATLAHESAGHFTQVKNDPIKIRPVGKPKAREYVSENPWTEAGEKEYLTTPALHDPGEKQFLIRYAATDLDGQPVELEEVVGENSPLLKIATSARILDRMPTGYSAAGPREFDAEVAAQVVTGIPVPYEEALVTVPDVGNFAKGYGIDPKQRDTYADRVGVKVNDKGVIWNQDRNNTISYYGSIYDDPDIGELARATHDTPLPPEDQLITILAYQRGHKVSAV